MTKYERESFNNKKAELQRRESFSIIPDDVNDKEKEKPSLDEREMRRERRRQLNQRLFENGTMDLRRMIFLGDDDSDYDSEWEEEEEEQEHEEPKEKEKKNEDTQKKAEGEGKATKNGNSHLPESVDDDNDEMSVDLDQNLKNVLEKRNSPLGKNKQVETPVESSEKAESPFKLKNEFLLKPQFNTAQRNSLNTDLINLRNALSLK